ncbi:hypothetical protein ACLUXI_00520 [Bifidobacterium apri]|uniref:hypothetical protein n=1 Tax=Bifidobacterium apri TaxID=1769423 RepID=UPI003996B375
MTHRSALVGRSNTHSARARMIMDPTITPMDPQKHGMKSGLEWSVQNQTIKARINARPAAKAASLWNTRASVRMGCVTQSHRQRDDEQGDDARTDDCDAQVYREHV